MKISDMIQSLRSLMQLHGDLDVKLLNDVDLDFYSPQIDVIDPNTDEFCVENKGLLSIGTNNFVHIY